MESCGHRLTRRAAITGRRLCRRRQRWWTTCIWKSSEAWRARTAGFWEAIIRALSRNLCIVSALATVAAWAVIDPGVARLGQAYAAYDKKDFFTAVHLLNAA